MHSASAADPLGVALDAALEQVLAAVSAAGARTATVVIDGRSGAGKSTLARRLASRWPGAAVPQLVHLDSFYPGWGGLAAATRIVDEEMLTPRRAGRPGTWPEWDWERSRVRATHTVRPESPLIIEGSGALSAATARCADVSVWVDAPSGARRARALHRDPGYEPFWTMWSEQERQHISRHRPQRLADIVVQLP